MQTITRSSFKLAIALTLVVAMFGLGRQTTSAYAACSPTVSFNLYAKAGSISISAANPNVTIWGYSSTSGGAASLPGPVLDVPQGTCVGVTLYNNLPLAQATALVFQGQSMVPDTTGITPGNSRLYTFTASNPGTFLYEAGLTADAPRQVAMGMYGALIVRPIGFTALSVPNQAYGPSTQYQKETLLVLSEFDTSLAANPTGFDMRNFKARYSLINGKAYPDTVPFTVVAGNTVLLRYVNAGVQAHAMSTLGLSQTIIAQDGFPYTLPHKMVAETIATGQTLDTFVTIPAGAAGGTMYAVYDANMLLKNNSGTGSINSGTGGMLVFLTIGGGGGLPGPDTLGPLTSGVTASPNPTNGSVNVTLSASISDTTTGNHNVDAAEYFIDSVGANGSGLAMSGAFGTPSVSVSATLTTSSLASLSSGSHTLYIHGRDDTSTHNWGPVTSVVFILDKTGPTTSNVTLSPNPSNGSVGVTLSFTANDSASGNSNVTAAEYWIDAAGTPANGTGTAISVSSPAAVKSLSIGLAPPFTPGSHAVLLHSQDALGNWGTRVTVNLMVDNTGPTTSGVSASPAANNGSNPLNTSVQAVRVSASFSDPVASGVNSNVTGAEGFIDTVGANGSGFAFIANDGTFNSTSEAGYADVPLAVINALANGNHTIYIHARDAVGNWGATTTLSYLIDRTTPTFTSITLSPTTVIQTVPTALTVNGASDPLVGGLASGVSGGEYWFGTTNPAPGGGTPFSGLSVNIPTGSLAPGTYTVRARVRDLAGNWSTNFSSASLTIIPNTIFVNGFDTGNRPWGWTSASTNTSARLNVTTSSPLVGTRSLQAQGNNTNYVQYSFGSSANPATATFDGRFYFRPNANASTGQDILAAATTSTFSTQIFHVRYRLNGGNNQVQIQVGNTANASWYTITNATHYIEVTWESGSALKLYVDGALAQTISTAATGNVSAVRLGSVTSGGSSTLEYFDAFSSKRLVSPLVGP
jgi:hypothetical protein